MKFAHMADAHIGSWREPRLKEASLDAFVKTIDICIEKCVDFIIISGDLFNTSLPAIDKLKEVVKKLKQLKEQDIAAYIIPGSHDFSPSGKTMLDVLENAGLVMNVVKGHVNEETNKLNLKFTVDEKTGAKITGMLGKKGMLEKHFYESLETNNLEQESGFKIFMFHTALTELKPKSLAEMDSAPISLLPKGFDYYAGGHVHIIEKQKMDSYGLVVYPGPLFPNNFKELEELKQGGFYIWEEGKIEYIALPLYDVISMVVDCNAKSPIEVRSDILKKIETIELEKDAKETIVTLRLKGVLREGKITDIALNDIIEHLYSKCVYFVMKNTSRLSTKEFEEVKLSLEKSHDIEEELIKQHISKSNIDAFSNMLINNTTSSEDNNQEKESVNNELIKEMMDLLDLEKQEGERIIDFEQRIKENIKVFLDLEKI
jgi:DNA repair protein SbcD/Mre11